MNAYVDQPISRRGTQSAATGDKRVVFAFTGQGSQHSAMGRPFYGRHDTFRLMVDICADLFDQHMDVSVKDLLLADGHTELLENTAYQQPALFTFEYALAQLWMSRGVIPDVMVGHSLGEIVAVTVADCLDLCDAVALVAQRALLMHECAAGGSMLGVAAESARALEVTSTLPPERNILSVAAINCPDRCVLAGSAESLKAAAELLRAARIPSSPLKVSHAFHSPLMAPAAHRLGDIATAIGFRTPRIAVISALDGCELSLGTLEDSQHWVRHCLQPVNFLAAVEALSRRNGPYTFIEVGPSHTLLRFAQRCVDPAEHRWLSSSSPTDVDCREFEASMAAVAADA